MIISLKYYLGKTPNIVSAFVHLFPLNIVTLYLSSNVEGKSSMYICVARLNWMCRCVHCQNPNTYSWSIIVVVVVFGMASNLHSFCLWYDYACIALNTSKTNRLFKAHCVRHVILRKTRKSTDSFESVKLRMCVAAIRKCISIPFTFRTSRRQFFLWIVASGMR